MLGLNPWLILICVLAFVGSVGGSYLKGRSDGKDIERSEQLTQSAIREQTMRDAQEGAAKAIAQIEVKNVTVKQQLETRIVEKPVYKDCEADDDVFRLTNESIVGAASIEAKTRTERSGQ